MRRTSCPALPSELPSELPLPTPGVSIMDDTQTALLWLGLSCFWLATYNLVLVPGAERLQRTLLQDAKVDSDFLNTARDSWTNIGIVSALGLTIAAAMVQAEPIAEPMSWIGQSYAFCTWIAYGMFLMACLQASVAVFATNFLSEEKVKSLLNEKGKDFLTRPLLAFINGFMYVGIGFVLEIADVYGRVAAIFVSLLFPLTYVAVYRFWSDLASVASGSHVHEMR